MDFFIRKSKSFPVHLFFSASGFFHVCRQVAGIKKVSGQKNISEAIYFEGKKNEILD